MDPWAKRLALNEVGNHFSAGDPDDMEHLHTFLQGLKLKIIYCFCFSLCISSGFSQPGGSYHYCFKNTRFSPNVLLLMNDRVVPLTECWRVVLDCIVFLRFCKVVTQLLLTCNIMYSDKHLEPKSRVSTEWFQGRFLEFHVGSNTVEILGNPNQTGRKSPSNMFY